MIETKKRSLAKTMSWRCLASGSTFFLTWLITGDVSLAGILFVILFVAHTALYFVHERIWNKIQWGKK